MYLFVFVNLNLIMNQLIFYINRCTRGLTLHTFHGNFFVRSTDLLSLPNVNPDAGFGMQVSIEGKIKGITSYQMINISLDPSNPGEW